MITFALLALVIICYMGYQNWQQGIKIALVLVVLEGALRKWALPQASQLIYFLKDFVLLGAYLRYFSLPPSARKLLVQQHTVKILFWVALAWCAMQSMNPGLGSPIIGLVGLKNYFFYVPIMWMLPALFPTEEDLFKFLRSYLLLLIPVGLLAIAQFFSPPDSPLNVYAWGEDSPLTAVGGDLKSVRVTGTFSYIVGYAVYLSVCLVMLLPLFSVAQPRLWQWATTAEFLIIAVTGFMTGSRGLILSSLLILFGYFSVQGIASFSTFFQTIKKFIVPGLLGFWVVSSQFQSAYNSFMLRLMGNQDVPDRVSGGFWEPFANFEHTGIGGFGTGATFQANGIIRNLLSLPNGELIPVAYEGEMGRIALEIGPLGFLIWYGLKLLLLIAMWNTYAKVKNTVLRQIALCIFLYQAITFSNQIVFNHSANLYCWFLNGFIFLLPQLDRSITQRTLALRTPPAPL
jgi:hypothetical protein